MPDRAATADHTPDGDYWEVAGNARLLRDLFGVIAAHGYQRFPIDRDMAEAVLAVHDLVSQYGVVGDAPAEEHRPDGHGMCTACTPRPSWTFPRWPCPVVRGARDDADRE